MNAELLAARPCVLHEDIGRDVVHLLDDVELAQPIEAFAVIRNGVELILVRLPHLADRMQPVIDRPAPLAIDRRRDTAAATMADAEYMLHAQHVDRELEHSEIVGILRRREIRHTTMDEQLARIETDDLIRRHAAVRTADPRILRRCFEIVD